MKKTKQAYFRDFPNESQTKDISGCREFEGQDLKCEARKKFFQNKQKQWLEDQMEQKRQRQQRQKMEEQMYSNQEHELNRMRGMLEDNFQKTKNNLATNQSEINRRLCLERKEKEQIEKANHKSYQVEEADYLKQRGAKQEFYMDVK